MRFFRSLVFICLFYPYSAILLTCALPIMALPDWGMEGLGRFWATSSMRLLKICTGTGWTIRGLDKIPPGPCLIASKHQSLWEVVTLMAFIPGSVMVSKRDLFWIPVFGWHLKRKGAIFLDRKDGAGSLRRMLVAARKAAAQGRRIVIFSEGTRRPPGAPPAYKPGIAALYQVLNIPCVPIALNSGVFWPRRRLDLRPGLIVAECLPPIAPGMSRKDFMRMLIEQVETASDRLAREAEAPS